MGESRHAQCCQWLGRPAPTHVAARIRPTRNVGASRTGNWWLRTAPRGKRSSPTAPAIHLLHCVHPSWGFPPSTGLPTGLRRPPTIQFWLRASTSTTGSVCTTGGPPSTCHSWGSTSGLPTASISGCPGYEQAPNSTARLSLQSVWLWTGLGQLWAGFLRSQPAAPLLWGPLSARLRGPPCRWKWLRTRSEPQRSRIPPLPTLASW